MAAPSLLILPYSSFFKISLLLQLVILYNDQCKFLYQIRLPDYPTTVYLAAGIFYDAEEHDHVIICGGVRQHRSMPTGDCYKWTPEGQWEAADIGNLNFAR